MRRELRRLRRIEARRPRPQPPEPPDPVWRAQGERWLLRLLDSMDEAHLPLLYAYAEDLQGCHHAVCPVPEGLKRHLDIVRGWIGREDCPVALPPAIVDCYLTQPPVTGPWHDCEDCGYPVPVTGYFDQPSAHHFPRCPLCEGVTGWEAWVSTHDAPYGARHR